MILAAEAAAPMLAIAVWAAVAYARDRAISRKMHLARVEQIQAQWRAHDRSMRDRYGRFTPKKLWTP